VAEPARRTAFCEASSSGRVVTMRFLVTGAAGFIGSHISERLTAEGHDVRGLDDFSEGAEENLRSAPEVHLIRADLRDEKAVLSAGAGCHVILHQGAVRSVPKSMEAPGYVSDVNIKGTINVLLAAREVGARVVLASSSSVYGDQERFPLSEDMVPAPKSPYAASKLSGEICCAAWSRAFGVPAVALRYFNVYGPRQDPQSEYAAVVPRFILACVEGGQPIIHGDGGQSRDFTYVEDVVEANLAAAASAESASGQVFNIGGGGEPISIRDLLARIAEFTGTKPEPMHVDARPGDVYWTQADISRAWEQLGWRPAVSLEQGLKRTVEWFRSPDRL
jgi:UDP-N-acetylglucosamine/UDP-N-acetyl-alpha-D-glucosaminouronate 4-epimerase